uniref:Uncharacterized protein n=1 Tax=Ciona intestinalis TaxID=7719 RepID=H2Y3G0_CIOIN
MFRNLSKFSLLFLLVFPTVMLVEKQGLASAEDAAEDEVMNEDEGEAVEEDEDESVVEEEGETEDPNIAATEEETEDEAEPITAHREAETAIIFNSGAEPEETLKAMNKGSPSPGRSPRKRHTKKASAAE